jgi:release factor glutamine methyltransferase
MKLALEQTSPVSVLIVAAAQALAASGIEGARLDAELLMAAASGASRAAAVSGAIALDDSAIRRFADFVTRRAAREPLAYIVGRKEFYSLDLEVGPSVLIPRPETETLVAAALDAIADRIGARVLDIGTGSGAIAIAIAVNRPDARLVATDISADALELARRNAARIGCADRIEFRQGDCWEAVQATSARFDLVVSNPPYIRDAAVAGLEPEISRYEPAIALRGGPDGLALYRRIVNQIRVFLEPHGNLLVEMGEGQAPEVIEMCAQVGARSVQASKDLAGFERVVQASF